MSRDQPDKVENIESKGRPREGLVPAAARVCSERPTWSELQSGKEGDANQPGKYWETLGVLPTLVWSPEELLCPPGRPGARGTRLWPPCLLLVSHLVWAVVQV